MPLPQRSKLPHDIPFWVDSAKSLYFITICCNPPRKNQLATAHVARAVIESIAHRNDSQIWFVKVAMLMPDHIHMLVSFPQSDTRMKTVVSKWKEWNAKTCRVKWQRDFFEHRLRNEENERQKANYILANPVRAGLVDHWENWPYRFVAEW
jgi:putative transposase